MKKVIYKNIETNAMVRVLQGKIDEIVDWINEYEEEKNKRY